MFTKSWAVDVALTIVGLLLLVYLYDYYQVANVPAPKRGPVTPTYTVAFNTWKTQVTSWWHALPVLIALSLYRVISMQRWPVLQKLRGFSKKS